MSTVIKVNEENSETLQSDANATIEQDLQEMFNGETIEISTEELEAECRSLSKIIEKTNNVVNTLTQKPKNKYRFRKLISQGGMKNIIRVKDSDSVRDIAMAVMVDHNSPKKNIERFVQEARITANLEHPNIVPIHDLGVNQSGLPYFTMKLIGGESLAAILDKLDKGFPNYIEKYNISHLLQIFLKICDAVDFAHSRGVIHLDLKPENIQVGDFGEVLVLDWGIAKILGADEDEEATPEPIPKKTLELTKNQLGTEIDATMDGVIKGSIGYMAPEQASGRNSDKDQRTDVFQLGAILYSLLTYRRPVDGNDFDKLIDDAANGSYIPIKERNNSCTIPKALEAVTNKAMMASRSKRYQTVHELRRDIDSFISGRATVAEEAGMIEELRLFIKRHRYETLFVSAFTVSLLILLGVWVTDKLKRYAAWGERESITPAINSELTSFWKIKKGNWKVIDGKITAVKGAGDTFAIFYDKPVYGNIALEFDAMIEGEENLKKSGDLSAIIASNLNDQEGYYLQTGGVNNTSAVIQRRDGIYSSVNFKLEANRKYHIRAEKEGEHLRLYCDGKLLLEAKDTFYLEGGYIGLYTFGEGKKFWNLQLYHRGVPELVSPLFAADSFYRESRASKSQDIRNNYLESALKAYTRVYESHPKKSLGQKALLKRAYVNLELNNLKDAKADYLLLENTSKSLDKLLLKGEICFRESNFEQSYDIFSDAIKYYPESKVGTVGIIIGKLSKNHSELINSKLLMKFWRLCAENQSTPMFRCRNRNLTSLEFMKGLDFQLVDCSGNKLTSLYPLDGMSLNYLDFTNNNIVDLSPLAGMPITELFCGSNKIKDISALVNMPLKTLSLENCINIQNISVLKKCKELEKLILPPNIKNVEFIKELSNLKYVNTVDDDWQQTKEQFLKKFRK